MDGNMNQLKDAQMYAGDLFWIPIDIELLKACKKFYYEASKPFQLLFCSF